MNAATLTLAPRPPVRPSPRRRFAYVQTYNAPGPLGSLWTAQLLPYFGLCLPRSAHGRLTVRALVENGQMSVTVLNTDLPGSVVDCMASAKPAIAWTGKGSMEAAFIY